MEQLKKQLKWSKAQTKYAWAKYYEERNISHNDDIVEFEWKTKLVNIEEMENIPIHIVNELKQMIKELKKKIECPVCLTIIDGDDLKISNCGHKYCNKCYDKLEKCAICRKKWVKYVK